MKKRKTGDVEHPILFSGPPANAAGTGIEKGQAEPATLKKIAYLR